MQRAFLALAVTCAVHGSPEDVALPSVQDALYTDAVTVLAEEPTIDTTPVVPGVVDVEKELERCKAQGYSNVNAYVLADNADVSALDPQLIRHCNAVKYRGLLERAAQESTQAPDHLRFWHSVNDTTYQDLFEKHILLSHPVRLTEMLHPPPAFLTSCFAAGGSSLDAHNEACAAQLSAFNVPLGIVNDYLQRVEPGIAPDALRILLPTLLPKADDPIHCSYGFHMVVTATTDAVDIELLPHLYEGSVDADGVYNDDDVAGSVAHLFPWQMAFIPSGYMVTASAPVLRFCFADASNFNRIKQHLRVEGLVNESARALLLAFQAPTFDTKMVRRPTPTMTHWSAFTAWPKPERIAKESDSSEALSRRERYKIWQDDKKWDGIVHGLTLPVTRPPIVARENDIGRTFVHLTWQDLYQGRKGDITVFGYDVHWTSEDDPTVHGHSNLSHTALTRSALPTTAFGGDFDGRAIQGYVRNLRANTSYTFSVRLFVGDAVGLQSERSQVIRTKPSSVPEPLMGLPMPAESSAPNCIQLTWLPVDDDGGCPVEGYAIAARFRPTTNSRDTEDLVWQPFNSSNHVDILPNSSLVFAKHDADASIKNVTGTICNLRSKATYQFQVAAENALGFGSFSVWSEPIRVETLNGGDTRDVIRGRGAPHFHRLYDRLAMPPAKTPATGPVLVFSDSKQTVAPYQLVGLANPKRQVGDDGKVVWSTWRADVWTGHHSIREYDVIAVEAILADPVHANEPLRNAQDIRDRIVVIYRGGAPFYNKVARAQAAGAVGVLLIDAFDQCADGFDQHCSPGSSYSAGEGLGAKDDPTLWKQYIRIPYALVRKADATPLIDKLTSEARA
uniref:Secreted protein n=1 Tax=Achlya hypogyna TaxID=1202772 RepID=A0A0A7CNG3_ACHHY|nr:secreted protein [Achlya hypogyna]